jgi:hypothetical protein
MDCRFRPLLVGGPPHRLAVDGDHISRSTGQRGDPGDEAVLEPFRVQRRKDVAQMIVGGRSVAERQEAPQKVQLLHAKAGDIREGFRSGQHRQQA